MFLLDTVVLSELRKPPRQRNRNLVHWIEGVASQDLFVSVVTIGEIERGIERQRQLDPPFAGSLAAWLDTVLRTYEDRILPVDIAVARRWGRLSQQIGNKGLDLAVAATALEHGLTVATRNVSDFEPTGVSVLDPFSSPPRRRPSMGPPTAG
jgi:predicted nucleic acid-binding protein